MTKVNISIDQAERSNMYNNELVWLSMLYEPDLASGRYSLTTCTIVKGLTNLQRFSSGMRQH